MIQLRFIKRDLDCIVPTQIVMLLENFWKSLELLTRKQKLPFHFVDLENVTPMKIFQNNFSGLLERGPEGWAEIRVK